MGYTWAQIHYVIPLNDMVNRPVKKCFQKSNNKNPWQGCPVFYAQAVFEQNQSDKYFTISR